MPIKGQKFNHKTRTPQKTVFFILFSEQKFLFFFFFLFHQLVSRFNLRQLSFDSNYHFPFISHANSFMDDFDSKAKKIINNKKQKKQQNLKHTFCDSAHSTAFVLKLKRESISTIPVRPTDNRTYTVSHTLDLCLLFSSYGRSLSLSICQPPVIIVFYFIHYSWNRF